MSKEAFSYLQTWTESYVRLKDVVAQKIDKIKKTDFGLEIKNNDDTSSFVVVDPSSDHFEKVKELKDKHVTFITLNAKPNLDALIKEWTNLNKIQNLTIVFVNPFSITEEKWIVNPYVHDKIADPATLDLGLKTMFDCVEEISLDDFLNRIKEKKKITI
jgi:hypothetical protein